MSLDLEQRLALRYGENPHQSAALFSPVGTHLGLAGLRQLAGKELSYNNLLDLDAATRLAGLLQDPGAAPLVIGVTGHRDPTPEAVLRVRDNTRRQLEQLMQALPHTPLVMLNGMAAGIDTEIAEEFLAVVAAQRVAWHAQPVGWLGPRAAVWHDRRAVWHDRRCQ